MSIDPQQLRKFVIRPACEAIGLYSLAAEELLLGTACQESNCGRYLHQLGAGPALGIFQMEPATYQDIWRNYLEYHPDLARRVRWLAPDHDAEPPQAFEMVGNLKYAAAMCRIFYHRVKEPMPSAGNLSGHAHVWKQYYNTPGGAGTVEQYVKNWNRFVNPLGTA